MCNLTNHFNEEVLINDPEYISYMNEKFREMKEYHDWYVKSLQNETELPFEVFAQEASETITEHFDEVWYDLEVIDELINK